jgi:hypothetical protein
VIKEELSTQLDKLSILIRLKKAEVEIKKSRDMIGLGLLQALLKVTRKVMKKMVLREMKKN